MSANPTRLISENSEASSGSPLAQGNLVLESIGRQESLRALLNFSNLREEIERRRTNSPSPEPDLFQTELFVLDEVLQLICARAQNLTQSDGVIIALSESSGLVCRATAGPLNIPSGIRLLPDSEFLQRSLETGRILRCDDSETDPRVAKDLALNFGARATVLVPLRGRWEQLGVIQAFSLTPWSFTDQDIRCFDLFAELVLSALKPPDQDRRFHWLSDVAGEVLQKKTVPCPDADAIQPEIQSANGLLAEPLISESKPSATETTTSPLDNDALSVSEKTEAGIAGLRNTAGSVPLDAAAGEPQSHPAPTIIQTSAGSTPVIPPVNNAAIELNSTPKINPPGPTNSLLEGEVQSPHEQATESIVAASVLAVPDTDATTTPLLSARLEAEIAELTRPVVIPLEAHEIADEVAAPSEVADPDRKSSLAFFRRALGTSRRIYPTKIIVFV